jgi:hypothetical protein
VRYDASEGEFCGIRCEGELGRCTAVSDEARDAAPMDVRRLGPCAISISAGES